MIKASGHFAGEQQVFSYRGRSQCSTLHILGNYILQSIVKLREYSFSSELYCVVV